MDKALEEKILDMFLPLRETEESFPHFLQRILSGGECSISIHLQVYVALRQAQNQLITLQEFIDVARDEIEDPLYHDLTCSIDQFFESNQLSRLHGKKPGRGKIWTNHPLVRSAIACLQHQCKLTLTDNEKDELTREGENHGCANRDEYLQHFVLSRIME